MSLSQLLREVKRQDTIVSMRYRQWLTQHGDEPIPDEVAQQIYAMLTARQRERFGTFSPSSSGRCLRRQELEFLGIPSEFGTQPDSRLLNIFNDGRWRHLRWQANLLSAGILHDVEVSVPWRHMRAKGSVDGRGYVPMDHPRASWRGLEFGFELKGVNPWGYNKAEKNDKQQEAHLDQIHRYFLQGGFDLFVCLYEHKDTNNWIEWVIEPDMELLEKARWELTELNKAIDKKKLHPMLPSCRSRMGTTWTSCPYTKSNGVCESSGTWPLKKPLRRS